MTRANPLQAAFNAGELGPRLAARVEFAKYAHAGARVENLIPLPQGGLTRRPGTRFVATAADATVRPRLMPFEFSTEQAYVIEAGAKAFRFFKDKGRIEVADTDAAISNGTFDTDLTDWDDVSTGATEILVGAATQTISGALGTNIGNMAAGGGLAAAFNGDTTQGAAACALRTSATSATVGKNWGAGNTKAIISATVHGSNDAGFCANDPVVTLTLQGSSDNFNSDINNLGSRVFTDTGNEAAGRSITMSDTTTPYQYHRILITHNGSAQNMACAEVVWTELDPNPLDGMQLVGDGSDIAWAEQDVATSSTDQEHVLAFRVRGVQGDRVRLSIGTTSTGGEIVADMEYGIG